MSVSLPLFAEGIDGCLSADIDTGRHVGWVMRLQPTRATVALPQDIEVAISIKVNGTQRPACHSGNGWKSPNSPCPVRVLQPPTVWNHVDISIAIQINQLDVVACDPSEVSRRIDSKADGTLPLPTELHIQPLLHPL